MIIPLSQWTSVKSYVINQQSVKTGWNSATWWKSSPKAHRFSSARLALSCDLGGDDEEKKGGGGWDLSTVVKVPWIPYSNHGLHSAGIFTIVYLQSCVKILLKGKCRDSYTSIWGSSPSSSDVFDGWVCSLANWMVPMAQFQERRNREAMAEHQPRWLQPTKIGWCPIRWWKWHRDIPQKKVGNVGKIYESSSCTLC